MPQPYKLDRPKRLEVRVPTSVHDKVMEELYSDLEGRVPLGQLSDLVTKLFRVWLKNRGVEL